MVMVGMAEDWGTQVVAQLIGTLEEVNVTIPTLSSNEPSVVLHPPLIVLTTNLEKVLMLARDAF